MEYIENQTEFSYAAETDYSKSVFETLKPFFHGTHDEHFERVFISSYRANLPTFLGTKCYN